MNNFHTKGVIIRPNGTNCRAKSVAHDTYSRKVKIGPFVYLGAIQRKTRNLCARLRIQKLKVTVKE